MPLTNKGIRKHTLPIRKQTAEDKVETERLAKTYAASLDEQNTQIRRAMGVPDAIKEAMLSYAPALSKDYEDYVHRQFKAITDDLGVELKGVYSSSRWARPFQAIRDSTHQEVSPSGRTSTYSLDEIKLKQNAKRYGEQVSLEWYGKLRGKLGELDNVTVSPPNRGGDVVVTGEHDGDKVRIDQQRIFKVSQLGTPFHQFPARIYVNDKFMSESAYKKVVRGWNVPVVIREQKPKREPIDVESRPKKYYFIYLVDLPRTAYREASVDSEHRDSARGMTAGEALAKLKKNEERFERDYPPSQRRRLHDFELDAIYAWNDRLIWRKSSGEPNPYSLAESGEQGAVPVAPRTVTHRKVKNTRRRMTRDYPTAMGGMR